MSAVERAAEVMRRLRAGPPVDRRDDDLWYGASDVIEALLANQLSDADRAVLDAADAWERRGDAFDDMGLSLAVRARRETQP